MNEETEQLKAATLGMFAAIQAAIRALVTTHPHPDALIAAMKYEAEETIALLLARRVPDATIEAFRDTWNGLALYQDGGSARTDPRL